MVSLEFGEATQEYIQDCEVCCQPINFRVVCTDEDEQPLSLQVDRAQ